MVTNGIHLLLHQDDVIHVQVGQISDEGLAGLEVPLRVIHVLSNDEVRSCPARVITRGCIGSDKFLVIHKQLPVPRRGVVSRAQKMPLSVTDIFVSVAIRKFGRFIIVQFGVSQSTFLINRYYIWYM